MTLVPSIDDEDQQKKKEQQVMQHALHMLCEKFPVYKRDQLLFTLDRKLFDDEFELGQSMLLNCRCYIKRQCGRSFLDYKYENYRDLEIDPRQRNEEEMNQVTEQLCVMDTEKRNEREKKFAIIQHPHILRPFAFIKEHDNLESIDAVVLEYVEPLQDYIDRVEITEEILWKWAYQLANVMHYLHRCFGILYRALAPESIFIDENGNIKLGEFAYSRSHSESEVHSITPQKHRAYMAPETFGSPVVSYTYSSDVWSYGMVLYYLTHKQAPFRNDEVKKGSVFRKRLMDGERPPLSQFRNFHNLIQSCWKIEPTSRPIFEDIQRDIRNILKFPVVVD